MLYYRKLKQICLNALLFNSIFSGSTAIKTMFSGDSDVEGWSTDKTYPNSVNKGIGGYTCKQVKKKLGDHLDTFKPVWVVLVCGENDLWGQSATATFKDFMNLVNEIVDTGARVLYMGTKPEPGTKRIHSKYRSYDAKIRAKATEMAAASSNQSPPLIMVDVYPVFDTIQKDDPGALYQRDKLHLSKYGYSYWDKWATTALADDIGSCIRWENNLCVEKSNGGTTRTPSQKPPTTPAPTPSKGSPSVIVAEAGVNVCPSGYTKIQSEQGCKEAMSVVEKSDWQGDEDDEEWPSKCYFCNNVNGCTEGTWFNKHKVGASRSGAKPICALPGWEDDNVCGDDSDWIRTAKNGKTNECNWVGKNKSKKGRRCRQKGDDGRVASEACRYSCLVDDKNWLHKTSKGHNKKCIWVQNLPKKRCKKTGEDGRPASEACAFSCLGYGSEC